MNRNPSLNDINAERAYEFVINLFGQEAVNKLTERQRRTLHRELRNAISTLSGLQQQVLIRAAVTGPFPRLARDSGLQEGSNEAGALMKVRTQLEKAFPKLGEASARRGRRG